MSDEHAKTLGPLAALVGTWEGDKGDDRSPSPDRTEWSNPYRERIVFEPTGQVDNHEQTLFGLRYRTTAWRVGVGESFHEEVGYWLWDAENKQVIRSFVVPRGISVIAGGTSEADARSFHVEAERGSTTYGICANQFLDKEFRTIAYALDVTLHDDGSWSYAEDTVMEMPGRDAPFHHTDANRLYPVPT